MDTRANTGLTKFLERRSSCTVSKIEKPPRGRTDCASLELLSGVALERLRQSGALSVSNQKFGKTLLPESIRQKIATELDGTPGTSPVSLSALQGQLQAAKQNHPIGLNGSSDDDKTSSVSSRFPAPDEIHPQPWQSSIQNISEDPKTGILSQDRNERPFIQNGSYEVQNRPRCLSSRFCHICSRTTQKVSIISCKNFFLGTCRKVICEKCFMEYGWDWGAAIKRPYEWQCTHCQNICPSRAQCSVYRRTNERRREQQQRLRVAASTRMLQMDRAMGLQDAQGYGIVNESGEIAFSVPMAVASRGSHRADRPAENPRQARRNGPRIENFQQS